MELRYRSSSLTSWGAGEIRTMSTYTGMFSVNGLVRRACCMEHNGRFHPATDKRKSNEDLEKLKQ